MPTAFAAEEEGHCLQFFRALILADQEFHGKASQKPTP
jgi:hypothetical protein